MLRRHPVVRRQNIRAEADLRILNRKPPVNIFHRTDIPAAVQLQNDAPRHRLLRLQIFHHKLFCFYQLINIFRRTSPRRFDRIFPEFAGLDRLL